MIAHSHADDVDSDSAVRMNVDWLAHGTVPSSHTCQNRE